MKKIKYLALILPLLTVGLINGKNVSTETTATVGSTEITISKAEFVYDTDSFDRMGFKLYNKENVAFTNAGIREGNTSLTPKLCFNGTDYTFGNVTQGTITLNGYVSMFAQQLPEDGSYWPIFFKHPAGQGASGNVSWYPEDYPGLPKNEETTIGFYANTVIGQYKIMNDFTLRVQRNNEGQVTSFAFIYSPHEVTVSDATVSNTFLYNSKTCASLEANLKITPTYKSGFTVKSVSVVDSDSETVDVTDNKDGTYSVIMPNKDITISVNYEPSASEETEITINKAVFVYDADSFDRMGFKLYNKENVAITNANVRKNNTSLTPTICFNGTDYTFGNVTKGTTTLNGYISMLSQEIPEDGSYWPMFFKHPAGQGASGNVSWYPEDYPGLPKNEETTIGFYANTIIGQYKIVNDFTLRVQRNNKGEVTSFAFIYLPHEVNVSDATVTNSYLYNSKLCASLDANLIITPTFKAGFVAKSVSVTDSDGNNVDVTDNKDGTFSAIMPDKDISISVSYEEAKYSISFEGAGTVENIEYGKAIGTIPEGKWEIDGYPISSKSIFLWKENKTATKASSNVKEYKCECYVDGELYQTLTFTDLDTKLTLPAVPYKEGYTIVGWDLEGIQYKDLKTNAVYIENSETK